jgi:hypothetical protein
VRAGVFPNAGGNARYGNYEVKNLP